MASHRGFGLVEALIGLLVLTLGLLAVLRAQPEWRRQAEVARQRSEALRLAQAELERLRAAPAAPMPGESLIDDPASSTAYRLQREVDGGSWPGIVSLTVTATWTDHGGQPQQVRLPTLRATLDPVLAGVAVLPR
ncbi:MAG: hypothetical protein KF788_08505 [Piscinibacter sp.]|nr:hypothetical protein [Piscinibacter sp.]